MQNNLTEEEVEWRSRILGESFADDAKICLKRTAKKTLQLRDFDYLRQSLVFNYIYKNTDYFSNIKYLILDDGDEITPICFDFIKYLTPQLKEVFAAYDDKGASRAGYLSADRTAVWEFEKLFKQNSHQIQSQNKLAVDAQTVYNNITENRNEKLKYFSLQAPSKRAAMLDDAIKTIKELLGKNILPSDISIITPVIDDMLKFTLKENLTCNLVYLSGSEKLIQTDL
ncbi:MAG: hypothetical protein ACLSA2_07720 [Candidatus Gastranaerophilaceae bacterium]